MKQKLRNVLFSSYLLVSVIPIVVLIFISLYLLSDHVKNDVNLKNNLLAKLTANEISTFINGKFKALNIIKDALDNSGENSNNINELLQSTYRNFPSFENIIILDKNGRVKKNIPNDPLFIDFDFSTNNYFIQTVKTKRSFNTQSYISPRTKHPTILITVPYKNGIVAGFINLSQLNEIILKVKPGEKSSAAITDANGVFISHTDYSKVEQSVTEENYDQFKKRSFLKNNSYRLKSEDEEILASFAFVENLNWSVIIYQDSKEAFAEINGIKKLAFGGIISSIIIILFIALRRSYSITKPVLTLTEKMKEVASGNYSSRLNLDYYDEFNKLVDEFNLMIENVYHREKHYSSLFYDSKTKLLLIDNDTRKIVDANNSAAEFFGLRLDQLKDESIDSLNFSVIFESINHNKIKNYIAKIVLNDSEKYIDVYISPIALENNSLSYVIIHNITERILAERKLEEYKDHLENLVEERTTELQIVNQKLANEIEKIKQTEEKLRDQLGFFSTVLDTIPIPIFIRNKNKDYLDCNKFFEKFVGKNKNEIIGKNLFEIIDEKFALKYSEMDDELLQQKGVQSYEDKIPNSKGEVKEVIFNKATLVKSDGETVGIVGSFQDITTHKLLQTEIKKALDSEKELNELKTRFISTTSHEFRTPLTAILSSADLLELYGRKWTEEKYLKHTNQIRRSVKYMTELLDDILTISRAESGKVAFNPSLCRLRELCMEVLESVKVKAKENHKLSIAFSLEQEYFYIDEKLIKQILTNLLSNAIKYSPDGGDINLNVIKKEDQLIFYVKDCGIGIPDDEKKNLMIPFYRTKNAATIPGTGLGLSIVNKSVELHGGKIYFESEINKGSLFCVTIPIEEGSNEKNTYSG